MRIVAFSAIAVDSDQRSIRENRLPDATVDVRSMETRFIGRRPLGNCQQNLICNELVNRYISSLILMAWKELSCTLNMAFID